MRVLFASLIALAIFNLQPVIAQTEISSTLKEQLENLNKCWKDKNFDEPFLQERTYLENDISLIQMHLSLVEKILRSKSTDNLTKEQKNNRVKSLDILHTYWVNGVFPQNLYHGQRTPYFIDDFGTNCAVGEMVVQTGYNDFAQQIRQENNYLFISELNTKYPLLQQWANTYGFKMDELAWIQPGYIACDSLCDEAATASAGGGTPPYTYLWSNGETTAVADSLCPGNWYSVTITDSLGDTMTNVQITYQQGIYMGNTFFISPPYPPIYLSLSSTPDTGSCNGTATANASGGSPSYTYQWSPGGQTDSIATGLCYETYYVTITDANGCSVTDSVVVSEYTQMTITIDTVTLSTCGLQNGGACISVGGGCIPYYIQWSNPNLTIGPCLSNVFTGVYVVYVIDNCGFTDSISVSINDVSPVIDSVAFTDVTCFGDSNGTATVFASGGILPYSYLWSDTSTTDSISSLSTGMYSVIVTDANNCLASDSVTINEPTELVPSFIASDPSCVDSCDGKIVVSVAGGVSPYTYYWYDLVGNILGVDSVIVDLCAGKYFSNITDDNGCTITSQIILNNPSGLSLIINTTPDTNNAAVGTAWVIVSGGTPPYSYQWGGPIDTTTDTATGLISANYTITVTDSNGCIITANLTVGNITGINKSPISNHQSVIVYPNPNTGSFTLEMDLPEVTGLSIKLYHFTGQLISSEEIGNITGNYTQHIDLGRRARGIYYLQVITEQGIVTKKVIYQ